MSLRSFVSLYRDVAFAGGLRSHEGVSVVATDGTVTDGPDPESKAYIGGFAVVDVPSRENALEWAADRRRLHRPPSCRSPIPA